MHRSILLLALWLTLAAGCTASGPGSAPDPAGPRRAATLGARTSAPSPELAEQRGLEFEVRWVGRVVEELEPGGAAERAGLRVGDVLVEAGGVRLFSQDDLDDLLRVSQPGQSLALRVVRDGEAEPLSIEVTLRSTVVAGVPHEPLQWQYASLVQLPLALGEAREKHKRVLVGLSGAET